MTETQSETMLYLVGLARAGTLDGFVTTGIQPEGTDQARVIAIETGDTSLDAIVVDVPSEMFVGDGAECRLQDVAWLRPRAERHEVIVRAARERTTVMPVGFGGVFSGAEALTRNLRSHTRAVQSFLDDTDNCDEWSLKAWVSRADAIKRAKATIADEQASTSDGGAAYLRSRRLDGEAVTRAEEHAIGLVESLIELLGETVRDATERRATSVEADPDRWLIAHVALLIDRDARAAFDATLDDLSTALDAEGLHLELSGPWSPYSFCPALRDDADVH